MLPESTLPRVIWAPEQLNWCFHNISLQVSSCLQNFYRSKIVQALQLAKGETDIAVVLWWNHVPHVNSNIRCKAIVAGVYDCLSWGADNASMNQFRMVLRQATCLAVANREIKEGIQELYGMECPPIFVTEDGVDTKLFRMVELPNKFSLGWTGNSTRHTPGGPGDQKGLGIIQQAARLSNTPLRILDAKDGGIWPLLRMPVFYQDVSVYCCASYREGTPNPVLESLSMGRPVVSTRVGLAQDLIKDGVNGYLVERTPEAFAEAVLKIKSLDRGRLHEMGRACRNSVLRRSWQDATVAWKECLDYGWSQRDAKRAFTAPASRVEPAKIVHLDPPVPSSAPEACVKSTISKMPPPASAPSPVSFGDASPRPPIIQGEPLNALLIPDVPGWAFDQNMRDLAEYVGGAFSCDFWYVVDFNEKGYVPDVSKYHTVFCVYHRNGPAFESHLPANRTIGSLRALWFIPENPRPPGQIEFDLVNKYRAFHVVTEQNYREIKDKCPGAVYLTNPVNMRRFDTCVDLGKEVIANWNGNALHRTAADTDVKGFNSIIRPAATLASIKLNIAEYHTSRLSPADMPGFYQKSNLAVCASLYEGASNSVMEAMASGQALLTTYCGNHREMQQSQLKEYGETGIILVERSISGFARALKHLRQDPARVKAMGLINRAEILRSWSWDVWRDRYIAFLMRGLRF